MEASTAQIDLAAVSPSGSDTPKGAQSQLGDSPALSRPTATQPTATKAAPPILRLPEEVRWKILSLLDDSDIAFSMIFIKGQKPSTKLSRHHTYQPELQSTLPRDEILQRSRDQTQAFLFRQAQRQSAQISRHDLDLPAPARSLNLSKRTTATPQHHRQFRPVETSPRGPLFSQNPLRFRLQPSR